MREPKENASSLSLFRVSRGIIDQLNGPLCNRKGCLWTECCTTSCTLGFWNMALSLIRILQDFFISGHEPSSTLNRRGYTRTRLLNPQTFVFGLWPLTKNLHSSVGG